MADIAELSPELAGRYNSIFSKISHVERNGHRLASFYALYQAYMENGAPQPPELIIRLTGLTSKEARKTFTIFAESKTGYRPPDIDLKPRYYVVPYFETLGLCEVDVSGCIAACDILERTYPKSKKEHPPPQKICAAVIFYYCKFLALPCGLVSSRGFNEMLFSKIVGISLGALKGLSKKLAPYLPPVIAA